MSSVMVVENNHAIRTMYATALSGYGYDTIEVETIAEAKRILKSGTHPAVILLDLNLPDGSGQELIRYVRQELKSRDMHIIVATGTNAQHDAILDMGADMLFVKPVELVELLNNIHAYSH